MRSYITSFCYFAFEFAMRLVLAN